MNKRLFAGVIGNKYIILRFGWFGFGHYATKTNHYKEYRTGLFLLKVENWN